MRERVGTNGWVVHDVRGRLRPNQVSVLGGAPGPYASIFLDDVIRRSTTTTYRTDDAVSLVPSAIDEQLGPVTGAEWRPRR